MRASMRHRLDRLLQLLVRLVLGVFFRRLELEGGERVPASGPLIVVANHVNSLIDPLLVIRAVPRMPRLLAKSTLWQNPGIRLWLDLAAVIPVYRRQDEGTDPSKNLETFARCHELLRDGGVMCLFPEGISHDEPQLQPMKTGAARIAVEAEQRFGPLGVQILPVGLEFEDKEHFRSRALIRVGEPIAVAASVAAHREVGFEAVRELTARIETDLRRVTLNFASWEEARLVEQAADVFARPDPAVPEDGRLAERVALCQAVLEGYQQLRQLHPERVQELAATVRQYQQLLAASGLRDDQVGSHYPARLVGRYLGRTLLLLALRLPLAVLGTVLNWLPYRIPGWIAAAVATTTDTRATYKVFSAVLFFPLFWLGEAIAAGYALHSAWVGAAVAAVAPLSGWVALRFHERRRRFAAEARAYLLLRTRRRLAAELKARRQAVLAGVAELAARL